MSERGPQYRAFISYSHADSAWGRRIHRGLETYKLPAKLIGTVTMRGAVPARLSPIFRDREELSAGVDLSAQVQDALAASDALIIICSPQSKASFWVGKEIETFRALHPERPIFAALIEGEPSDAFPDALVQLGDRVAEPIAADFRKSGDGARLAKLKLVAGLTGLKLDDLVQRDAQRQWRRVMAVTLVAGVAVLIMALLLVMALRAQSEAERQRAEAEGIVEYMLTDLRDKLKGVGRLDVMAAVNERAMGYYQTQASLGDMPPESLERRARILHAMGEDDEKRGDLGLALKKFEEAHRTTAAVLARKPDDADAIFAHAQSEYWVGRIAELRGQFAEARQRYKFYALAAKRLFELEPSNPDYLMEMAWAHMNLGNIDFHTRRAPEFGQKEYETALTWMDQAARKKPNDIGISLEVSNAYAWLADSLYLQGKIASSIATRKRQLAMNISAAKKNNQNTSIRFEIAKAHYSVAANLRKAGYPGDSQSHIKIARTEMTSLVKFERNNTQWTEMLKKVNDLSRERGE